MAKGSISYSQDFVTSSQTAGSNKVEVLAFSNHGVQNSRGTIMNAIRTFCAIVVGVTGLSIATVPTQASELQSLVWTGNDAQVVQVRDRHRRNFYYYPGDYDDYDRPRHHSNRNSFYLNGYRGEREFRRGYRFYNGFYFPPSAFSFSINIR
jgi:hypothetical protein